MLLTIVGVQFATKHLEGSLLDRRLVASPEEEPGRRRCNRALESVVSGTLYICVGGGSANGCFLQPIPNQHRR